MQTFRDEQNLHPNTYGTSLGLMNDSCESRLALHTLYDEERCVKEPFSAIGNTLGFPVGKF